MSGPKRAAAAPVEGPLSGLTVVVTGSIEGYTRDSIRDHLAEQGAKVTDSVSKKTDYVVAGEGGGSKRAKADKLGVPVVSLDELLRRGRLTPPVRPAATPASSCTTRSCSDLRGRDVQVGPVVHDASRT